MSGTLSVLSPGLQTTVQDLGRWGHQAHGVPVAGAMDPFAHRLANALVGNGRDAATLEVTLVGPHLRFDDARVFAIAGASFEATLDERAVPLETPVAARPGALLTFRRRYHGARGYLAVGGGVDVPPVLGSRATHVPTAMGGMNGRALGRGDVLPLGVAASPGVTRRFEPTTTAERRAGDGPIHVRVLAGPQEDRFLPEALRALLSAPYRVGADSNRMGYRLEGPALRHRRSADVISDATPIGSIQVPGAGQPVLLMADRQTTGGYAKLATVITADIGAAAQAAPGDFIQFVLCTPAEAVAALVGRERPLLALERGA
jgi:antagonist of KipI